MSNGNNCGCGSTPVQPGNQVIVPPGTHIVQQPCATTSPQSVGVSPSALNSGQAANNPNGECAPFAMPTVARSFVTAGTNQTGSFFSNCAGNWGLPGMLMYFPSQGQLEILGVSQNTVTYRNRTVAPGIEILEGTRFAVGIPMVPVEVVDTGDDGGGTPLPTETTYNDATQLSNIRGVLNNIPSRILPVKNNVLVGRGGGEAGLHWVRRQLGQMRFPTSILSLVAAQEAAATKSWTVTLPGKPVLPDEVENFAVELQMRLWVSRDGSQNNYLEVQLSANDHIVLTTGSDHRRNENASFFIANLAKDATSIKISTTRLANLAGTMGVSVHLLGYRY